MEKRRTQRRTPNSRTRAPVTLRERAPGEGIVRLVEDVGEDVGRERGVDVQLVVRDEPIRMRQLSFSSFSFSLFPCPL